MPKFFFDVDDGICHIRDPDGQRFCNQNAAGKEATGLLADIAKDLALKGRCNDITVDMRNETGQVVFTATLSVKTRWVNWNKVSTHPVASNSHRHHSNGIKQSVAASSFQN